jgi:hypothetical protein
MITTCEVKLRTLAGENSQMVLDLGQLPNMRWYDRRLEQGQLQPGATCLRIKRVSTQTEWNQGGIQTIEKVRFQIDVLDFDPEAARSVAADVDTFLAGISLCSNTPTSISGAPCFKLNQRGDMEYRLKVPAYVETLDYRIWNDTGIAVD